MNGENIELVTSGRDPHLRRRRAGVTLIDGLIATFVMVLLLLGLTSLLMASRVNAKLATENNAAYNAARQVIENVRLHRGVPLAEKDYTEKDVRDLGAVPQIDSLVDPDIAMNVSPWKDPGATTARKKIKLVKVTVSWQALGGTNARKTRTFVSLVTPNGVVQ